MLYRNRNTDFAALSGKHLSRLEQNLKELADRCEDDVSPRTSKNNSPATNMIQDWHSKQSDHEDDTNESFIR